MAASDPLGGQKFWINGVPFLGIRPVSGDTGSQKFWLNGVPASFLLPAAAAGGVTYPELERSTRGVHRGVVTGSY